MKALAILLLAGYASCAPTIPELTPEVVQATNEHLEAHAAALKGEHIALAPVNVDVQAPQIANAYLDDVAEVKAVKATFKAAFAKAEAGEHIALRPVNTDVQAPAPVHVGVQIPATYLADLPEVTDAKAAFKAAFAKAVAGEHIALRPVNTDVQAAQIPATYLADLPEVTAAKAKFKAAFAQAEAGEHIALRPVNTDVQAPAPVHVVPAPTPLKVASPAVTPLKLAPIPAATPLKAGTLPAVTYTLPYYTYASHIPTLKVVPAAATKLKLPLAPVAKAGTLPAATYALPYLTYPYAAHYPIVYPYVTNMVDAPAETAVEEA